MKSLFLTLTFMLISLSFASCASPGDNSSSTRETAFELEEKTEGNQEFFNLSKTTTAQKVEVKDQALNMTMMTLKVPAGWVLHQDVASNPNGSGYLKFLLAIESPEGEIHGFLPLMMNYNAYVMYGQQSGVYFDELVNYLMHYCSRPFLEKFIIGNRQSDREALASDEGRQYREFAQNYTNMVIQAGAYATMDFDIIKMDFSASRKNVP